MKGKLIVFEGGEGSGKTTQLQRSRQWLESSGWLARLQQTLPTLAKPLLVTREPGGTALGIKLRQLLLNSDPEDVIQSRTELLLFAADRAQHVATRLQPHLEAGGLILCDRFTDSTVAYQGYGRGLSLALIDQLNQIATDGLTSDLTLWLDLDVEMGLERSRQRLQQSGGGLDRIERGEIAFHQRVQQGFRALSQAAPERIVTIDASQPEAMVADKIQRILEEKLWQWYPQVSML
uniref:Thymidylate kinase n=1 Tax=Cyanothece sp. (strain PCC 7425 / ATCC 29141) TaxID=395961 RepID=KTHY_CYAP4|nr:RecName: Full=Thymidylate kinase; AltName: Full=dTMP kinase [Cyanothece sp. PCC 7425]